MFSKLRVLLKSKFFLLVVGIIIFVSGIFLIMCELASRQVAQIFNNIMARQQVLAGKVIAEKLSADLWGNVYFTNISWMAPNGDTLVDIQQGRMKIRPWDIITKKPSLATIEELELQNAFIHVGFDDNMHFDVLKKSEKNEQRREPSKNLSKNLKLPQNIPDIKLIFKDTVLSAEHKKRKFILNNVNGYLETKHHKNLIVHLSAGKFGGSIIGDGFNIDGKVNLQQEQDIHMNLGLYNVVPSSLGLSNADDPMTITGEVKGTLSQPTIDGVVDMKELNLPGLNFTKVNGNYHYANGLISLENVTGSIYGGTLEAYGLYHFDTHHYKIDVHAKDLLAAAAAKNTAINCEVDLDIKFRNLGRNGNNLTYGSFKSGRGTYMLVPFRSISGKFSDQNKEMAFTDVVIETDLGKIESNLFKISNGKLQLNEVVLVEENGTRTSVYKK